MGLTGLSAERQIEIIETYPDPLFDQMAPKLYSEVPHSYQKAKEIAQKVILPMIRILSKMIGNGEKTHYFHR